MCPSGVLMVRFVIWEPWRTAPWGAMNNATILKTQVCHYQEKGVNRERRGLRAGQATVQMSVTGAGGGGAAKQTGREKQAAKGLRPECP